MTDFQPCVDVSGIEVPLPRLTPPVLSVRDLNVRYAVGKAMLVAAEDVNLDLHVGEAFAIVGESGCGKSSVARAIMQLVPQASGRILIEGHELGRLSRRDLKALRSRFQMIFQDPISSLNPRRRVQEILEAPLRIAGVVDARQRQQRVEQVLELVGLDPKASASRFPHEFSGGQCQRISIARALMLEPALLVCDEPVSALDVSVRAQVLNLLNDLRASLGLSLLFISHDFAVVRNIADKVAVMYLGRIVEAGDADEVLTHPAHPYTVALLSAVPEVEPSSGARVELKSGELPSPLAPPGGCRFHPRCPAATPQCEREAPPTTRLDGNRQVACHRPFALKRATAH